MNKPGSYLFLRATGDTLAIFRVVVFSIAIIHFLSFPLMELAYLPREIMEPVGLLSLLPEGVLTRLLSEVGLSFIWWTSIILSLLVIAGTRPHKLIATAAVLSLFLADAIVKSYASHVNHAQFGFLYVALILAFFPASDRRSIFSKDVTSDPRLYKAAALASALVLLMPYMFIGARRLSRGLDIFLGDQLINWIALQSVNPSEYGFEVGLVLVAATWSHGILKLGFFIMTLLELFAPLIIVSAVFRRVWIVAMLGFHAAILIVMNILFWENVVLIMVLFTGYAYAGRTAETARDPSSDLSLPQYVR